MAPARSDPLASPAPTPNPTGVPAAAAPAVSGRRPPDYTQDLMLALPEYWDDLQRTYEAGSISVDDYAQAHRQRVHDDENPMLQALRPPPPEREALRPTPERGDLPTELEGLEGGRARSTEGGIPEVHLSLPVPVVGAPGDERGPVADVAAGVLRGPLVAMDETTQALTAFAEWLTGLPLGSQVASFSRLGPDAPETGAGQLAQGVSQFVTLMLPVARGIQGVTGAGKIAAGLLASPVADFFAFDPQDPRLANLIETHLPGLSSPITEYLQATGDEGELEGRLKNVLEGVLVEGAAAGVLNALRFVKSGRAVVAHMRTSQAGEVQIPGPPAMPHDGPTLAQQYADAVIEARRGGPRSHPQVQAEAQALVDQGLVSMDTVRTILPGTSLNDAEAVAVVQVLADSGLRLKRLAARALETGHPADLDAVMQQLYLHGQVDPKRIGVVTEAGRTLRAMNDPTAGLNRFLVQFEELLRNQTAGADPMALVRAIAEFQDPGQLAALARQTSKPGFWAMFKEYYVNGLLWGPKTWMANLIGNTATTLWAVPERGLAGVMGGNRGVQAGEAWELMHGMLGSVVDAWRLAAEAFRQEESQFARVFGTTDAAGTVRGGTDKIELPQKAISAENLDRTGLPGQAVDWLGTLVRFPSRILAGTDDFFKVVNYRAELRAQAFRQARQEAAAQGLDGQAFSQFVNTRLTQVLGDPPVSIQRAADEYALYQTFTNELGETGQQLQALAATPAGKIILPFVRTPVNIFKYATERTPLGLLMQDVRHDLFGADLAARDLARAKLAMGSLTMSIAGVLAYDGRITGAGPSDPELQRHLRARGWQPYSLRVGNKYISYSRTEPVGMLLGLAADWVDAVGNAEGEDLAWAEEVGAAVVTAVAKNFSSRTFVKGVAETMSALADPERSSTSRTSSLLVSLLPASALIRQVEQGLDPTMAEAQTVLDRARAQIPGLSAALPPRRDLFGEPILLTGVYGPVGISTAKPDPVLKELITVKARAPELPRARDGIELTRAERDYWARQRGQMTVDGSTLHARLAETMASAEYRSANRDHKAFLLELDIRRHQHEAWLKTLEQYPNLERSLDTARAQQADRRGAPPTPGEDAMTPLLRSLGR